ncbi:MAG: AAA family ATPase [Patescibacteria group bacterium]
MYLKRLELSGFKSFAKHIVLDFTTPITAVVGPNGSGKSNVAEALQWALGEQSMKSLRGKRGEDLIFAGSPTSPRLGRATVTVVFDNSGKKFGNLDFDEVVIERKVYRDGVNEYFLNGSKSRLKDIIEVLSNVGLGASQHHIISQGEADRILYSSSAERRAMIEDALGIKIFQLKRKESERKLEATEENMRQVASLRREIVPHLRFLRAQAEKAEKSTETRARLKEKLLEYLGREKSYLEAETDKTASFKAEPKKTVLAKEVEIAILKNKLLEEEGASAVSVTDNAVMDTKARVDAARIAISQLERDLGRLEGMIEAEKGRAHMREAVSVSPAELEGFLKKIEGKLAGAVESEALEEVRRAVREVANSVKEFLGRIASPAENMAANTAVLDKKKADMEKELGLRKKEEENAQKIYVEMSAKIQNSLQNLRGIERKIYELESEASLLRDKLRSAELVEEKLRLRREEYERELEESVPVLEGAEPSTYAGEFDEHAREILRREIERAKIKLEEAGGVDDSVLKEFADVKARDEFLGRELEDLGQAAGDLRKIIKELETQLDQDFKNGIEKINKEFQGYFETMFGGGKAELKLVQPKQLFKEKSEAGEDFAEYEEEEEKEAGIDVLIDLPRKRIKSLDMLSGGERALTSIALLFAMSAVNPPPFLVLDETDAALDEANSRRYSEMLTGLSKRAQLIVITHNRETMHSAGALYGVTLGHDSISRLISIQLEEAEKIAKH